MSNEFRIDMRVELGTGMSAGQERDRQTDIVEHICQGELCIIFVR